MNPELIERINQTWCDHFKLPIEIASKAGTTISKNENRDADSFLILWPVGQHIVLEIAPAVEEAVQKVLSQIEPDTPVTLDDFKRAWCDVETSGMPMYAMDAAEFRPFYVSPPYTLRQLTTEDQPAFDAFLAQCSEEDKDEGDVSIEHMIAFGIFDGERIAAAGSVFIWRGFIDIGILTDPAYRKKGFGKALVSACTEYYLSGDKVVGYRHDSKNVGSRGIAQALNFTPYADVDMLKMPKDS
jgi:RimJ/RimL family protein N-acetyltransferase